MPIFDMEMGYYVVLWQFRNVWNFLSLRFYVKSILVIRNHLTLFECSIKIGQWKNLCISKLCVFMVCAKMGVKLTHPLITLTFVWGRVHNTKFVSRYVILDRTGFVGGWMEREIQLVHLPFPKNIQNVGISNFFEKKYFWHFLEMSVLRSTRNYNMPLT